MTCQIWFTARSRNISPSNYYTCRGKCIQRGAHHEHCLVTALTIGAASSEWWSSLLRCVLRWCSSGTVLVQSDGASALIFRWQRYNDGLVLGFLDLLPPIHLLWINDRLSALAMHVAASSNKWLMTQPPRKYNEPILRTDPTTRPNASEMVWLYLIQNSSII
jgi:hypothetical protein